MKLGFGTICQMLLLIFQISMFINAMQNVGDECAYTNVTLKTNEISATIAKSADVEDIWLNVQSNLFLYFTIGAIYRHPSWFL